MQTKSHHSTITEKSFEPARLMLQGGSFLTAITCQDSLGHSGEINEEKPCFVLGFRNHQKKHPLLSRLPLRNEALCARRGHFNYRQAWAVLPNTDPGRRARWGGGNRFVRPSLTLDYSEVQRGTRCWASTLLLRADTVLVLTGFAAFDLLELFPISKDLELALPSPTGAASGQACFQIETSCPTNSTTTEPLPLVSPAIWTVCQLKFSLCWCISQELLHTDPLVCNNI